MAEKENEKLGMEEEAVPIKDAKALKEEKKRLKKERKEQKKEAKRKAKELSAQANELEEENEGSSGTVLLVTFLIVVIWLAILALLIKLDVGGFGSGVLKPVLQDVPVINKILPAAKMPGLGDSGEASEDGEYYGYTSLKEAVEQIRMLELELESVQTQKLDQDASTTELQEEIARLKTFEDNQVAFEQIKNEFYEEVVYAEKGPGAEEYKKYYESMDPATAELLYKQVVQQLEEDGQVQEYASAYSEMKPKEAAAIFEAMEDDLELAAKILNAMSADDRGKILGAMNPEVAARITKIMNPAS